MYFTKRTLLMILVVFLLGGVFVFVTREKSREIEKIEKIKEVRVPPNIICPVPDQRTWPVQSVDTMKYSRDHARDRMLDANFMENGISLQVQAIAKTGATHIAINTPYDAEFLTMLNRWVHVARENELKVFFRGNWSGWEGWFEYPKNLTRQEHIEKTKKFILNNSGLFENGDIFSSCPECENGGPGDPRHTGDVSGHRKFLIDEFDVMSESFKKIDKKVDVANFSMNGDVAQLVMDKSTTSSLGGVVVIDHYVKTPKRLANDAKKYAKRTGGKIFIAELGAPAGHVHGNMSEEEQAEWIEEAFSLLAEDKNVVGINYWVNMKGSTALWNDNVTPRKAVDVLTRYYKPKVIYGKILDGEGFPIERVHVHGNEFETFTDDRGCFVAKFAEKSGLNSDDEKIEVSVNGFEDKEIRRKGDMQKLDVVLIKKQ